MPLDLSRERVFEAEHPVRHLFLEGRRRARRLIVVFSGFHPANEWRYNYVNALDETRAHRVYVLDDLGERGCYYLGADKDLLVERSVVRMLDALLAELRLDRSDVVLTGSSKGGTAALYYGVRHGYGSVLAGAPQTRIATYLTQEVPAGSVARLIAGSLSPDDLGWLDEVVFDAVRRSPHRPEIELFTSDDDLQQPVHVTPMISLLRELGYPVRVTKGTYRPHRAVAIAFPYLLQERFCAPRTPSRVGRLLLRPASTRGRLPSP